VITKGRAQKRKTGGRAFVIMPFDRAFDDLHRQAIRPALEQFGLVAERYDDAPRAGAVLEEMRRSVDQARLVIAVVTGKNPHVFFELGITLARGKPCVLLAGSAGEVPDFLGQLPCVVYRGNSEVAYEGLIALIAAAEEVSERTT
jgi:nucleoside 2-deoxyribosyltransferase